MSLISAKVIGSGIPFTVYSAQAPGVIRGMVDYIMSRGDICNFKENPKRYKDGYREEESDTDATRWGNLTECMSGLSGKFEDSYAVAPTEYVAKAMKCPGCGTITDSKTCRTCQLERVEIEIKKPWNSGAMVCEKWVEKQGDREIIKSELHEKAKLALFALEADSDVSGLFHCSKKQVMVVGFWKDRATGLEIPLRCLLDLVPDAAHPLFGKSLADFKTARESNPDFWDGVVNKSGYDVQAALGIMLYEKATGENRTDWLWPLQQNVHPYHVTSPMPGATSEFLRWGHDKLEAALTSYAKCLATGNWPSFSVGNRVVIAVPPYQMIGPEKIWAYREAGGAVASRMEYEPEPQPPRPDEKPDVGH